MFEGLTPGIAGTASVVLLALVFASVWRLLALLRKQTDGCEETVAMMRADCQWKDAQKAALIFTVQQAGLQVPDIAWQDRPSERDRDHKGAS